MGRLCTRGVSAKMLILCQSDSSLGYPNPWSRRPPQLDSFLLPLREPPTTSDNEALLGFQPAECGGKANVNQQGQHIPTAWAYRCDDGWTGVPDGDGGDGTECAGSQLVGCWGDDSVEWGELFGERRGEDIGEEGWLKRHGEEIRNPKSKLGYL